MGEERCWFCRRSEEDLMREMPPGFWDEQQDFFYDVEIVGNVRKVDRVRPGDPSHNRHFTRSDSPPDEVCTFDDRRYAVISRKRKVVQVCRVCQSIELGSKLLFDDSKGAPMVHRHIYPHGADELTVARTWERINAEEKRLKAEFPDDAHRVLVALQKVNHRIPISLWDLANQMSVFNHRTLEAPMKHILTQCPQLGRYDKKEMALHFSDPGQVPELIKRLLERYEAYYDRDAGMSEKRTLDEGISRIKKVNNPLDTMQYYSKW